MKSRLSIAEAATAVLLTLAAIWLRVLAAVSAGALWRDEANTVALATLPSITDVWSRLEFDSVPLLWLLIVRWVSAAAGPMNDIAFRWLGLVIGVGVVASLWWYARVFRYSFPLVSLALLALSPSVVVWGDSMRGLGAGILFVIVTGLLLWRFLERPTFLRFAFAALAAAGSVQTLFYNTVFVLAFCVGAIAVCIDRRDWRTGGGAVAVGGVAALSLIPYAIMIRAAASWKMLVQIPDYNFLRFVAKLYEALRPGGPWAPLIWAELLIVALFAAAFAIRRRSELGHSSAKREVTLFSAVTLLVAVPAFFIFLHALSYPTRPWYYLSLLAVCAVCIDAISGSLINKDAARKARLLGVLILGFVTIIPASGWVSKRLSNIDSLAARITRDAAPEDLIVVTPWYHGVAFARYYRGATPWTTIPPIEFQPYHRYDLVKKKMMMPDQHAPVAPLELQISVALRSGRRVFIVGSLPVIPPNTVPPILQPAPLPGNQWPQDFYERQWSSMIAYFLQIHATEIRVLVKPESNSRVSEFENDALVVATGWRP